MARHLAGIIAPLVRRSTTARLLALGHTAPLLTGLDPAGFAHLAVVSEAADRAHQVLPGHPSCGLVALPETLPFAESLFDQALVAHLLEFAERPHVVLRELWRVLAPASELILIVPNRAGLWTHFEATPFGQGRPWGRNELMRLLTDSLFEPVSWRSTLAAPPVKGLRWLDTPLTRLVPRIGGVHIVVARKTDGLSGMPVGKIAVLSPVAA